MVEKEFPVKTPDGEMTVFTVRPEGPGPYPVAVVYQDGIGFREQVRQNARRFARAGYYCVAPDLFYRLGKHLSFDFTKISSASDDERKKMMEVVSSVTPERAVADTKAALDAVASDPAAGRGPKVCVGYCMGARISLRVASAMADDFAAAAGIHPGALVNDRPDSPHYDLDGVRGELYFAFAEIDRSATPELVDRFRKEMSGRGVRGEVERLPGVAHGFAMADLPVYDPDAAERHFERTLDLWKRNLTEAAPEASG